MKAQITRKSFFHELCVGKCLELMANFHLLQIRTSIDIVSTEKCKVTFGIKYNVSLLIKKDNSQCLFDTTRKIMVDKENDVRIQMLLKDLG